MRHALLFVAFISVALCSIGADYQLFEENGKIGLKDPSGVVILPAAFEALGWSDGSFSMVGDVVGYKVAKKWGLINLKKERITEALYESLTRSEGDRIIVRKQLDAAKSKVGCIDLRGHVTIPLKYDGVKIFGLRAIAFVKEGRQFRYGVIDLNDNIIIPFNHQRIYPVGNLRFGVEDFKNKSALFSESGIKLTEFVIDSISSFKKNYAIIHQGFQQGLIDREGQIAVPPQYVEILIHDNGEIRARKTNTWKILSSKNETILTFDCDLVQQGNDVYTVSSSGKFGLIDQNFNPILPLAYDYIGESQFGKVIVKQNGKYGIIRFDHSMLVPIGLDSVVLQNNFVLKKESLLGKASWSVYDTFGIRKTEKTYEAIKPFNGKFFAVKNYNHTGAINRYGREIIHCVYDSLIAYNDDQLIVLFHGQYGVIDFEENWLLPPQNHPLQLVDHDHYLEYANDQALFKTFEGELVYFTDNPIKVADQKLLELLPNGMEKEVNFRGVTITRSIPAEMEGTEIILPEQEGYRGIKRDGRFGFIDQKGRLRIANRYEGIQPFSEGLAAVQILGKWGFINSKEKIIVNPSYEVVHPFVEGVSIVKRNGNYGLIDATGHVLLNLRYDKIERLKGGRYLLRSAHLSGLASPHGELLIEPRFDRLADCGNGFVIVSRDGKSGLLTSDGLSAIPMIYDEMQYLPSRDNYLVMLRAAWSKLEMK
jgi:hypothetical protein